MTSIQLAWLIRRHGIEMTHLSGGSHIASVMSVADIIAVLYADILEYDPARPEWDGRDRFIMSKGHAGAAVYAALAESGFFDVGELRSHYAAVQDGKPHRVFAVLGDGECDEGSVWEAALFANHYRLENLVAVIDHNRMQSLDYCENTLELEDLGAKWRAFGWNVIRLDGHDHNALRSALADTHNEAHKPTVVIADTVKGKGVSFMENDILWHYRFPHDGWEYDRAVSELYAVKPEGVEDPYTPDGIASPAEPGADADIGIDHTTSVGWHPAYFTRS